MRHAPKAPLAARLSLCLALLTTACADGAPTAATDGPRHARRAAPASQVRKPIRAPFEAPPVMLIEAGVACEFAVIAETLVNREVSTTFPADANGEIVMLVTGALVQRFTNADDPTKAITVNASGPGRYTFHPDGSLTVEAHGRWTFWDLPSLVASPNLFVNAGNVRIEVAPDGTALMVSRTGRAEDLCAALS